MEWLCSESGMPRTAYLSNHGIGHVDVGLSWVGDHHVVDIVPGLGPHVAYRDTQELDCSAIGLFRDSGRWLASRWMVG